MKQKLKTKITMFSLLLGVGMLFSGCSTVKVDIDYDSAYKFENAKTYAIVHKMREGEDTLTNDRVQDALKDTLNTKSYKEVEQNSADLIFVYHVNVTNRSDIRRDYEMV